MIWHKIEDCLPENDKDIILRLSTRDIFGIKDLFNFRVGSYNPENKKWLIHEHVYFDRKNDFVVPESDIEKVTHWAKLPTDEEFE